MAKILNYSKKEVQTLRRHADAINKHTTKAPISLIMEMLSLEASCRS
jgi:hypothetical protein